jgi:hypothetical protein
VALDEADARVGARTAEVLAHLVRVGVGFRVRARARGRAAAVLAHHDSAAVA